jgi:hypothetical protein
MSKHSYECIIEVDETVDADNIDEAIESIKFILENEYPNQAVLKSIKECP